MKNRQSKRSRWERLVDEFEHSNLTCAAFAERHGIGRDGLKHWWRKLRPGVPMLRGRRGCGALVPVQVADVHTQPVPTTTCLHLELPSGVRLRIEAHTEPRWIGAVVRALSSC